MIYNGCQINAMVEKWDLYALEDDGKTLAGYIGDGGGDTEYPRFDVWTIDEEGAEDTNLGDFDTIEEAKNAIDAYMHLGANA